MPANETGVTLPDRAAENGPWENRANGHAPLFRPTKIDQESDAREHRYASVGDPRSDLQNAMGCQNDGWSVSSLLRKRLAEVVTARQARPHFVHEGDAVPGKQKN